MSEEPQQSNDWRGRRRSKEIYFKKSLLEKQGEKRDVWESAQRESMIGIGAKKAQKRLRRAQWKTQLGYPSYPSYPLSSSYIDGRTIACMQKQIRHSSMKKISWEAIVSLLAPHFYPQIDNRFSTKWFFFYRLTLLSCQRKQRSVHVINSWLTAALPSTAETVWSTKQMENMSLWDKNDEHVKGNSRCQVVQSQNNAECQRV